MKFLITGVAGFIGYSTAYRLLKDGHSIDGIDNMDNYYSINYKKKRLKNLYTFKNFKYYYVDISDQKEINTFLKKKKFDYIIHLAAQAGVRYSKINPSKYIKTNMLGFFNILEASKNKKVKKILYASSSSVYGENNKFPLNEKETLSPKSIYAITKQNNEQMADYYSREYKKNIIGLRFFTIYGEWGRPDMFLFKLFKSICLKKKFFLNNYGNHDRDFTYIDDAVNAIVKILKKKITSHQVFNISSNNPINIKKIIKNLKKKNDIKINYIKQDNSDVLKTHGCNKKIISITKFKIKTDLFSKLDEMLAWYRDKKIYKYKL
jgi:UDP-glucuronate 4-epimerase